MSDRILIVEDDLALSQGVVLALGGHDLKFVQCHSLAQARAAVREESFSLVILDINLPDGNGLDLLIEIRRDFALPVILLTAKDMEIDVVAGLELGADDYITKPFSLAILRARVHALLRRRSTPSKVVRDGFCFDFERMEFFREGQAIELSKTEQKLLRLLVENPGQTLTRDTLMDRVWTGGGDYVEENALSVTIKRLRDKLEPEPSQPRYIKTVYGVGYMWAVK